MIGQPVDNGFEMERRLANPIGQDRAVQIEAGPRQYLALTIEWQMICIFANQNMGERPFGWQAAHDQMGRRWRLGHSVGAGPARIFRTHGDNNAQLCRHYIQPLCAVFADFVHDAAAARAIEAVRFDDLFKAR